MAIEELEHSRAQAKDARFNEYMRLYRSLQADLSEGSDGWTGTGLPKIADKYPYGTWTPTITTPRAYDIDVDPRPANHKGFCLITVKYRGPRLKRYSGIFAELYGTKVKRKIGISHWADSRKEYVCLTGRIKDMENALWDKVYPGATGKTAPRCREAVCYEDWIPGLTRAVGIFKTLIRPGAAKLYIDTLNMPYRPQKDLDGNLIGSPTGVLDEDGVHYWKLLQGVPRRYRTRVLFRLDTAYDSPDMSKIFPLRGCVNKNRLRNFGGLRPETVLVWKIKSTPTQEESGLRYVSYYLIYEPLGWNNLVKSQQHIMVAKEVPHALRGEVEDLVAGKGEDADVLIPGFWANANDIESAPDLMEGGIETHRLFEARSLSGLDGMVKW